MKLPKREEEDKLELKELLLVSHLKILKRKKPKRPILKKPSSNKLKEKSKTKNEEKLKLKELVNLPRLKYNLKLPKIRNKLNKQNLMPEDDLYKI